MIKDVNTRKTNLHSLSMNYWNRITVKEFDYLNFNNDSMSRARKRKNNHWNLKSEQVMRMARICHNEKMLLYTFLLSVWKIVVNEYFKCDNICLGVPQYLKNDTSIANNDFLLFPSNILYSNSFNDELLITKNNLLQTYCYQFHELNEIYGKTKISDKVNVFFCMDSLHTEEQIQKILNLNHNDLTVIVNMTEDNIALEFVYWTDCVEETLGIMNNIFDHVLNSILCNPNQLLSDIDTLGNEEREMILSVFNHTEVDYDRDKTIRQLFEEQAEKWPDNVAIIFNKERLTYRELNKRANSLADKLRQRGVVRDVIVGIMAERSLEMVVAILAVLKANGAYMPIDPQYPKKRIEYMISDSGVKIILTQTKFTNAFQYDCEFMDLNDPESYSMAPNNVDCSDSPYDLAYVIYTSGTTGKPKGVALENIGIVNLVNVFKDSLKINENKKVLQFASISFDAFAWELYMTILFGAQLHIPEKETVINSDELSQFIRKNGINVITVPPFVANELKLENTELELIITAGSEAKKSMIERLSKDFRYINAYGPTECTICATLKEYEADDCDVVTIGKPIANYKVCVVDKNNRMLPIGVAGELCIECDGIARGYLNKPELTDQKFITSVLTEGRKMYKTGDLAKWRPDGTIEFLGRIDQQVKIRGFRIEKSEIENQLMAIPGIRDAAVIDKCDEENKYLCAYYVSDTAYSVYEMRNKLKENLPDYMIPSFFVHLSEMPLNANGKIDIKELPDEHENVVDGENYEGARSVFEEEVVAAFSTILGVGKISINDNFFNLGGNSLNAVKISSLLQEKNISVSVSHIFMYQTIKEISDNHIEIKRSLESEEEVPVIPNTQLTEIIEMQRKRVDVDYAAYTKYIRMGGVLAKHPMAVIQKMSLNIGLTKSATKFELPPNVDKIKLEKVICKLITREGALRSAMVKDGENLCMYEYEKPKKIEIPYVDLSMLAKNQKALVLKEVLRNVSCYVHSPDGFYEEWIPHCFVLVNNTAFNYALYFLVNHMIFDGMSSEIVKNYILQNYINETAEEGSRENKSYFDYIEQITKGPKNISEDDIIKHFRLDDYCKAGINFCMNNKKKGGKFEVMKLEFKLPPKVLSSQDEIW
ncbi:MAG: non-ribosomal peptide synthetase, partial [Ruminiclostridium sp.]